MEAGLVALAPRHKLPVVAKTGNTWASVHLFLPLSSINWSLHQYSLKSWMLVQKLCSMFSAYGKYTSSDVDVDCLKKSSGREHGACAHFVSDLQSEPSIHSSNLWQFVMRDTEQINLLTPISSTSCSLTQIQFGFIQHWEIELWGGEWVSISCYDTDIVNYTQVEKQ